MIFRGREHRRYWAEYLTWKANKYIYIVRILHISHDRAGKPENWFAQIWIIKTKGAGNLVGLSEHLWGNCKAEVKLLARRWDTGSGYANRKEGTAIGWDEMSTTVSGLRVWWTACWGSSGNRSKPGSASLGRPSCSGIQGLSWEWTW